MVASINLVVSGKSSAFEPKNETKNSKKKTEKKKECILCGVVTPVLSLQAAFWVENSPKMGSAPARGGGGKHGERWETAAALGWKK